MGLGVVGMKTLTRSACVMCWTSPLEVLVRKPMA